MASISLFSPDGDAGSTNWHTLKSNLDITYDYTVKLPKKWNEAQHFETKREKIFVQEIFPIQASRKDQAYHTQLIEEGKVARGNQRASDNGIVDIPHAAKADGEWAHDPAISLLGTYGHDPAMVLAEMYKALKVERHALRDRGHRTGGEVENYVSGIRIANRDIDQENGCTTITPEEFRDIALYMENELPKEHPISDKINEVRRVAGYAQGKGTVQLLDDMGTVGTPVKTVQK